MNSFYFKYESYLTKYEVKKVLCGDHVRPSFCDLASAINLLTTPHNRKLFPEFDVLLTVRRTIDLFQLPT